MTKSETYINKLLQILILVTFYVSFTEEILTAQERFKLCQRYAAVHPTINNLHHTACIKRNKQCQALCLSEANMFSKMEKMVTSVRKSLALYAPAADMNFAAWSDELYTISRIRLEGCAGYRASNNIRWQHATLEKIRTFVSYFVFSDCQNGEKALNYLNHTLGLQRDEYLKINAGVKCLKSYDAAYCPFFYSKLMFYGGACCTNSLDIGECQCMFLFSDTVPIKGNIYKAGTACSACSTTGNWSCGVLPDEEGLCVLSKHRKQTVPFFTDLIVKWNQLQQDHSVLTVWFVIVGFFFCIGAFAIFLISMRLALYIFYLITCGPCCGSGSEKNKDGKYKSTKKKRHHGQH